MTRAFKLALAVSFSLLMTASSTRGLLGTPYARMNCSQFACAYTGHSAASAAQLFAEGHAGTPKVGDIVAFHGAHVAVLTKDGLLDSIPERGVGRVGRTNPHDPWYAGPIRIVTSKLPL